MTLVRSNPAGWALNDDLTSGQTNSMDAQIASALDKTVAGDQLLGVVTTAPGASFQASSVGGIQSTTPGGIALSGGASDNITFGPGGSAPRTKTRWEYIRPFSSLGTWTFSFGPFVPGGVNPNKYWVVLLGPATTAGTAIYLPPMHQGATLASLSIAAYLVTNQSTPPTNQPKLSLIRHGPLGSVLPFEVQVFLNSADTGTGVAPSSGLSFGASSAGVPQTITWTFNQNNVIDQTQYAYYAILTDQNGGGAGFQGIAYYAVQAAFSGIANMQFP